MNYFFGKREDGMRGDQMILPHEYLANQRILFLYGPIWGMPTRSDIFGPSYIADTMLAMDSSDSKAPIYLVIDSEGGSVDDGLNLYDVMKTIRAPVYTVGRNCYSMAAILLSAGEQGHRYIYPNSRIMLHLPSGGAQGNSEEIAIQSTELNKTRDRLAEILVENGGGKVTKKKLLQQIRNEKWMNAQETIDYGIADKLVAKGFFAELKR